MGDPTNEIVRVASKRLLHPDECFIDALKYINILYRHQMLNRFKDGRLSVRS